ncbi:hypothetical protein T459_19668 [Capsicum annuum]|uniref:DOG1 domain-containing protein n=1 Tax=Capsicum annuum TaxID=4072 RepID=A0A2G2Z2C2_CAPAN|nr:hypothetical protein T459_19668 [Capsicum annuum]
MDLRYPSRPGLGLGRDIIRGSIELTETKRTKKDEIIGKYVGAGKGGKAGTGGKSQKPKAPEPLELRGTLAFDAEYSRWLEEQNKHINELRNAVNSHASDPELLSSVNNVTAYFDEVFKVKGNAAKADFSMSSQECGKPLPSGVLCGMVASAPRNFLRNDVIPIYGIKHLPIFISYSSLLFEPSDAASGPISSMDARRSRDDSDPNDSR